MTYTEDGEYSAGTRELYNQIKEMFIGRETGQVLAVLEALTGAVVCNGCANKETAKNTIKEIMRGLNAYIEYQDKNKTCSWNQKRH